MEIDSNTMAPPNLVKLTPIPQSRRLSGHFPNPHSLTPVQLAPRRPLAWVSLQGRLVGAEEATSAKTVGLTGFSTEALLAWDLLTPIQRVLIVAVVAAATADSLKKCQIQRLQKCVQFRDEILASMQEKVDCLCEQVSVMKDQAEPDTALAINHCWLCDQHRVQLDDLKMKENTKLEEPEMVKCKIPFSTVAEPEERRMSDLSDWNCSVTSSLDIQLESFAIEQDVYNLKRDCEEKDSTIKELSEFIVSKDAACTKKVQELEDVIRQKSMIITKLRKDMAVLEQKVMHLTRLKRRSYPGQVIPSLEIPAMRDNLLYDMDSTTSPSSSDSDCSARRNKSSTVKTKEKQTCFTNLSTPTEIQHSSAPAKMSYVMQSDLENAILKPVGLVQENSMNRRNLSIGGDSKSRRRSQTAVTSSLVKRWV